MKIDFRENWHDGAKEPMEGVQGHLWLRSEFKTSLGNARHYHMGGNYLVKKICMYNIEKHHHIAFQ